ncbi:hypothetical protein H257_16955 [Aphanomyces astaci]|uniref:Integrase zinc-binding domain-containing protein n=1 Tax=Aphanomyces astaci TaxID=112090 RepID=W4FIK1_APHAT|nr:hypothetical protein H257_16955 [Aphanomyces astaci]ETV66651.1 hypothetical protein H257_16955 [Aphanomyces astaci]|eukprot:XP_009843879.1 hypothetical protein H257_16955 [Aphanomyces astaci]
MTPFGVYTPTRVLMGQIVAVVFCQSAVDFMFADLLFKELLAWLNDMLGYAETPRRPPRHPRSSPHDLLLLRPEAQPEEMQLLPDQGRLVRSRHNRRRPALPHMNARTACARATCHGCRPPAVCVRDQLDSVQHPLLLVSPLRQILDAATKKIGSAKKTKLTRIKETLLAVVPMAHPRVDKMEAFAVLESCKRLDYLLIRPAGFRLFTDHKNLQYILNPAGHRWGAAQAQVPTRSVRRLLVMVSPLQQPHFDWPSPAGIVLTQQVVVKRGETPPAGEACNENKNLFLNKEDRIWIPQSATDLQQRVCIIAHQGAVGHRRIEATTKAVRDGFAWSTLKVDVKTAPRRRGPSSNRSHDQGRPRWLRLEHPQSRCQDRTKAPRWGAAQAQVPTRSVRRLLVMVSPLQQPHFDWPSPAGIVLTQQVVVKRGETPPAGEACNENKNLFLNKEDRIWIPQSATDLQQRVCIIAHQGAVGHRRIEATTKAVRDGFAWSTLKVDVKTFVQTCCLGVDDSVVPCPLGSALHKILVVKDDMSRFLRLCTARQATTRQRQSKSKAVQLQTFAIDDFVLVDDVSRQVKKLSLHWHGPSKSPVADTQHLKQPYNLSHHHACRLKMYCEGGRDMIEDLVDHIAFGNKGFNVDKVGDVHGKNGEYQALVYWLGLDEEKKPHGSPCAFSITIFPSFSAAGFTDMKTKNK